MKYVIFTLDYREGDNDYLEIWWAEYEDNDSTKVINQKITSIFNLDVDSNVKYSEDGMISEIDMFYNRILLNSVAYFDTKEEMIEDLLRRTKAY